MYKIKRNSASYCFLQKQGFNIYSEHGIKTFCQYYSLVTKKALKKFAIWLMSSIAVFCTCYVGIYLSTGVQVHGSLFSNIPILVGMASIIVGMMFIIVILSGIISNLFVYGIGKLPQLKPAKRNEKEPSEFLTVLKTWYKVKKDKFCPLVKFEE